MYASSEIHARILFILLGGTVQNRFRWIWANCACEPFSRARYSSKLLLLTPLDFSHLFKLISSVCALFEVSWKIRWMCFIKIAVGNLIWWWSLFFMSLFRQSTPMYCYNFFFFFFFNNCLNTREHLIFYSTSLSDQDTSWQIIANLTANDVTFSHFFRSSSLISCCAQETVCSDTVFNLSFSFRIS